MTPAAVQSFIATIVPWIVGRNDLRGLALVGSWARGTAGAGSDLDLLVMAEAPDSYRALGMWLDRLPLPEGVSLESAGAADYGRVWSCHLKLQPPAEVELSFCDLAWADMTPIDFGTRSVVENGFQILVDKDGRLARLVAAL